MSIRILKKALGLLIVDIVIIIGIFVLQFRTDSSIIKKIGGLQVTLSQTENGNEIILKNNLRISYNGLTLFCDDQTPAIITDESGTSRNIQLVNWNNENPLEFQFNFTDDVNLFVSIDSEDSNAAFSVNADLPQGTKSLSIPYNFSSGIKVTKAEEERVILAGKKDSWEVKADSIAENRLSLSKAENLLSYAVYTETQKFSFEDIINLPLADALVFQKNVDTFKNNLISAYRSNSLDSNVSEQVAISYIADMAERGDYSAALEDIPQSFRRGKQKTFLSAPYFGSLDDMQRQFETSRKDYERRITDSANSGSLDIFTVHDIASYLCIHSSATSPLRLLQKAVSADLDEASIAQITGLIQVYVELSTLKPDYAQVLSPIMEKCIERITDACSFENNVLTISENDTFLSVIQAVETGIAILRYGKLTDNATLQKAGYVLVNSYMSESNSFDLRTLANLFPVIAYENKYIPHFEIINTDAQKPLIAWTCANYMTYEKEADGGIAIHIGLEEGATHYVILTGLPQFTRIYIYDMLYRTDPRFETYNSSGYVYVAETETLLLKSRHKNADEVIRFAYD